MANKSLSTRQKLMFRGTGGVRGVGAKSGAVGSFGAAAPRGKPPAPTAPGRKPGSGLVGGRRGGIDGVVDAACEVSRGAAETDPGGHQRRTKARGA